jgi:hypothetical protein
MEIKYSDYSWLYLFRESDIHVFAVWMLNIQILVVILVDNDVESPIKIVFLNESNLLLLKLKKFFLLIVIIIQLKDVALTSIREYNLIVFVRNFDLEIIVKLFCEIYGRHGFQLLAMVDCIKFSSFLVVFHKIKIGYLFDIFS